VRAYLLTMLVAAAVTYFTTPLVRRGAITFGAMAEVRDRDVHAIPIPRLGGVAMLVGILSAFAVASRLPFVRAVFDQTRDPVALLSGATLICLLGVVDDRWGLDAVTKLAGQVVAAGVMVIQGIQLVWLPIPRYTTLVLTPWQGVLLTIVVVVVVVNAVNFVDGLDGLAAGVVGIAALAFFSYSYLLNVEYGFDRAAAPSLITAVLAGACAGFLPHNFSPARIFMGDSGSMLIGLLLAASTISLTGQLDPGALSGAAGQTYVPALLPLLLPLAVLAVPFVDLLLAVMRRYRAGRADHVRLVCPDRLRGGGGLDDARRRAQGRGGGDGRADVLRHRGPAAAASRTGLSRSAGGLTAAWRPPGRL
jgi:UDP-GlcNAc:undecaprenyl-phosphate/decaprenyl-phosphate GlcNAc-1-phosphate transferase